MRFTGQLMSITLASAVLVDRLGRYAALYLLAGVAAPPGGGAYSLFLAGLKTVLAASAGLSFAGAHASLLRGRETGNASSKRA